MADQEQMRICCCNKAVDEDGCSLCKKYLKFKPTHIFTIDTWQRDITDIKLSKETDNEDK